MAAKETPPAPVTDLKELMVAIAEAQGLPQISFVDAMSQPDNQKVLQERLSQFAVAQAHEKLPEKAAATKAIAFLIGEEQPVARVEHWKAARGNMLLVFKDQPERLAALRTQRGPPKQEERRGRNEACAPPQRVSPSRPSTSQDPWSATSAAYSPTRAS